MAETTVASANVVQQWEAKFFQEYVRDNLFMPYMGTSENAVIQVNENMSKMAGDRITVSSVLRLINGAVTGSSTLEGSEENLENFGHAINLTMRRNGVRRHKWEQQQTVIDLLNAARSTLKFWAMDDLRDRIIDGLQSPVVDGVTTYASATETQKDTWTDWNHDRILIGPSVAHLTSTSGGGGPGYRTGRTGGLSATKYDHSQALALLTNSTDKLSPAVVSLAKRRAKTADPQIRPIRIKGGEEWFVMFAGSLPFRDLKENSTMTQVNREAWTRGKENPLFRDGDLMYDGVIIREVPEIGVITGAGLSSVNVAASFLCGAQSLGVAWAQRPKFKTEEFDYGAKVGVAVEEIRGVEKLMFNNIQNMVTVYTSAVDDA